ncbi:MAG TPA: methyl-accepting chemotaxis protein [Rickettsiales bacterium]|nr:methyl-accepting chemotaxis protein [Rickettsiales bacterium]
MVKLAHFKILTKILALLGLMALVALGATFFATTKMRYIDDTYGNLLDGPSWASISIARANRDLVYVDRSIYRLITETTPDEDQKASKEISDSQQFFKKKFKDAVKGMPAQKETFAAIEAKFDAAMTGPCSEVIRLAASPNPDDTKKAMTQMHEQCDPALHDVMVDISALNNKLLKISDKASNDAMEVTNSTIRNTYIFVLGGLLGVALLAILLTRIGITKPINNMVEVLDELANANFDVEIEGITRKDEVGDIAKAALVFRDQGKETRRMRAEQERAKTQTEQDRKTMMRKLAEDFESGVQSIITTTASAATELYQTAENMQMIVATVTEQSETASNASQQTSGNVQNVSAAVEQMSSSIKEIASQVSKSGSLVNETVARASQADKTTQVLANAVAQISGILELIQNIAGQINLLALNATIESARAGDAGKGFAVVASEVKNLAGQTTKATEEIARQIANVQQASQEVVQVLRSIREDISNVNQYSSGIASAVEQQSAATGNISLNMQQASQGVRNITGNITNINVGASEAGHVAKEVLNAAQELSKQSEMLQQKVGLFLENIKN